MEEEVKKYIIHEFSKELTTSLTTCKRNFRRLIVLTLRGNR